MRDVEVVLASARERGTQVGDFAARLLGGPVPWLKLWQAYGLLRLCDRYGQDRVNALCARAVAFEVIDVPRLEGMLKDARRTEDAAVATGRVIALPARFARDASAFATREEGGPRSLLWITAGPDGAPVGRSGISRLARDLPQAARARRQTASIRPTEHPSDPCRRMPVEYPRGGSGRRSEMEWTNPLLRWGAWRQGRCGT